MRRGPLTVVYGPDAIGKTAVVLHSLHHQFADQLARTLYVAPASLTRITTALSTVAKVALPTATSQLAELALELAEAHELTVVIEVNAPEELHLLDTLATYARASRWVAITTLPPTEQTLDCALSMAPLDDSALAALGTQWQGTLHDDDRILAIAASRGSPSRLRRRLAAQLAGGPDLLAQLDPLARRTLDLLSVVEVPLPRGHLQDVVPDPPLDVLIEHGLVEASPRGVEIRPTVRPVVAARHDISHADLRALADRLVAGNEPAAMAEAIILALKAGAHDLAARLLEDCGEAVLADNHSARLASILITIDDPRLGRWRLRAAVELGDGNVLAKLLDDTVLTRPPTDRIMWAEALMRANRTAAAIALISDLPDPAARLLAARGLATLGDLAAATVELERIGPHDDVPLDVSLGAAALGARIEAMSGNAVAARAGLVALRARLASAPEVIVRDVLHIVAAAYHDLGDLAATSATLSQLEHLLTSDPLGRFVARRLRLIHAIMHIERGELQAADDILAELDRVTAFASLHRPFIAMISAQLAFIRGQLHESGSRIATVGDSGYLGVWATALAARIAMLDASAAPARAAPTGTGLWPAVARLHLARLALRSSGAAEVPSADQSIAGDDGAVDLWFASRALTWERALLAGQPDRALAIALDTIQRCATAGNVALEAEAIEGALDAALLLGDQAACGRAISALDALGWARFSAEASFARALLDGGSAERLELLALGLPGRARRRARWLLGDPRPIDLIDRLVLEASRVPRAILRVAGPTAWTPGWGIDRRRRCAWRPDGSVIALGDKPQLWRLLEALVAAPDGISKEHLVVEAWEVEYHPLRHDKLLHNSIHKLRKLVEDVPTAPRRIPTTDDGYRLGDDSPVRVIETG